MEALLDTAPDRILRLLHHGDRRGARARVLERAEALGVPLDAAPAERLERLAGEVRHQGLVAEVAPAAYVDWAALVEAPDALLLAVDEVTDPRNLGAMLRSVEALGGTGALLTRHRCARLGPTVTRTSAGASELLPVAMETNLARALDAARDSDVQVVGADLDGEHPSAIDWSRPTCIVVGAEGRGLRRNTRTRCDRVATIPLLGRTESLNAAVAASVLFYAAATARHRPV